MCKSKQYLKTRDIKDLVEALEYIINDQIQILISLQQIINDISDEIKLAKAYREMRAIVNSLRPVQYMVEIQAPGMIEIFKQFEAN